MKIKTQFLFGIIFTIILSISATTYVMVSNTNSLLQQDINDKAKLLMNSLKGVAVESFVKKDLLSLNYFIKETASTAGLLYIIVTDRFDTIVGTNMPEDMGGEVEKMYPAMKSKGEIGEVNLNGRRFRPLNFVENISMKAKDKKYDMGKIYVGFDRNYIDSKIYGLYLKSGVIAILVIIIAVLITMVITSAVINPLKQLIKGTEVIAAGDLKYKIKVNVKNEFQALANSFNDMTGRLNEYYEGILSAFSIAIDAKSKYVPVHGRRVGKAAMLIAKELKLNPQQMENIRIASILMDIGNIGVQESILNKKGNLTADDFIEIQKHPEIGARIIKNIPALKDVVPIIMQHHERYDGKGYPAGLKGDDIMVEAKILAIADAYDAMITEREHRKAMSNEEAVYELRFNKGKQFDPAITENFVEVLNREGGV